MTTQTKIILALIGAALLFLWWKRRQNPDTGNGTPTGQSPQLDQGTQNIGAPDLVAGAGASPNAAGGLAIDNRTNISF